HLESVGELENVGYCEVRNPIRVTVNHVENIDEFLNRNILDHHFFLPLLSEISVEKSLEEGRMHSQQLLRHVQLLLPNLQNDIT
ncbi:hypothetical protein PMAYCL1PPCAC_14730, partial [Pristionchus mayeri]